MVKVLKLSHVLAQVNFGTNSSSILGLVLLAAGVSLYFFRIGHPEISRDKDILLIAVSFVCGLIFIFQGWRLDPILQFGQLLLVVFTIFYTIESIRTRRINRQ